MPSTASAKKRERQNHRSRERNRSAKSEMKTAVRQFRESVDAGDFATAEGLFRYAVKRIDQTASKRIIPKGRASRMKSRLSHYFKVRAIAADLSDSNPEAVQRIASPNGRKRTKLRSGSQSIDNATQTQARYQVVRQMNEYPRYPREPKTLVIDDVESEAETAVDFPSVVDRQVVMTLWPSDLAISVEMRCAARNIEQILAQCRELCLQWSNLNPELLLLRPKSEIVSQSRSNRPEFDSLSDIYDSVDQHAEGFTEGLRRWEREGTGRLSVISDDGDVRLQTKRGKCFGATSVFWLTENASQRVQETLECFHPDGRNKFLMQIIADKVALLSAELSARAEMLEKEMTKDADQP